LLSSRGEVHVYPLDYQLLHLACPSVNADCVYRIVVISTCMDVCALRPTLAMAMAIREWSPGSNEKVATAAVEMPGT
jgi:hypothetical protein